MKRKLLYPGINEAEKERRKNGRMPEEEEEPDIVYGNVPNYQKFERMGWTVEETLVWLNID